MKELYELLKNKAINCRTEDDAKEYLSLLSNYGYIWFDGESLNNFTCWDDMGMNTCYVVTKNMCVHYGDVAYYKRNERKVITYQQFKQLIYKADMNVSKKEMQILQDCFQEFKENISKTSDILGVDYSKALTQKSNTCEKEKYIDNTLLYLKLQSAYLQGWRDCKNCHESENRE